MCFLKSRIIKIIYPENALTNLEDVVNDIAGVHLPQAHTALEDALWLSGILIPLADYLEIYASVDDIMKDINDPAMMDIITFFPMSTEHKILDKTLFETIASQKEITYGQKKINNKLKSLVEKNISAVINKQPISIKSEQSQ